MSEIRLEIPEGYAHADHLGAGERGLVAALSAMIAYDGVTRTESVEIHE